VKAVLEGSSMPDQELDLDATAARRQQPLFGGAAATKKTVTVRMVRRCFMSTRQTSISERRSAKARTFARLSTGWPALDSA
jgi:hypothetical protein